MNQTMELYWTPERKDWIEAIRAVSGLHRWSRVLAPLAALGAVVAFVQRSWGVGGALLVFGVLLFWLTELQVRQAFRRNPRASKTQRAVFDDDGMHVAVDDARTDYGWEAFDSWREVSGSYLLRGGKKALVIPIPKRALGAGDADRLTELLTTHIGDRR